LASFDAAFATAFGSDGSSGKAAWLGLEPLDSPPVEPPPVGFNGVLDIVSVVGVEGIIGVGTKVGGIVVIVVVVALSGNEPKGCLWLLLKI